MRICDKEKSREYGRFLYKYHYFYRKRNGIESIQFWIESIQFGFSALPITKSQFLISNLTKSDLNSILKFKFQLNKIGPSAKLASAHAGLQNKFKWSQRAPEARWIGSILCQIGAVGPEGPLLIFGKICTFSAGLLGPLKSFEFNL